MARVHATPLNRAHTRAHHRSILARARHNARARVHGASACAPRTRARARADGELASTVRWPGPISCKTSTDLRALLPIVCDRVSHISVFGVLALSVSSVGSVCICRQRQLVIERSSSSCTQRTHCRLRRTLTTTTTAKPSSDRGSTIATPLCHNEHSRA